MKKLIICTLMIAIFQQSSQAIAETKYKSEWDSSDTALGILFGYIGLGVGATVGGIVGHELAGECTSPDPDSCFMWGFGELAWGAAIGGTLGNALGTYLYGEIQGYDGNFASALVGSAFGMASSIGLLQLNKEAGIFGIVVLNAVGPFLGYYLSLDKDPNQLPGNTALLNFSPESGLNFSIPSVSVQNTKDDVLRYQLSLISGTF
jgi:hypothetical protein